MCPIQNLKAVTMGMVTARALFWSNKPNPAIYIYIYISYNIQQKTYFFVGATIAHTTHHNRGGLGK
jgi:hypothetical protein